MIKKIFFIVLIMFSVAYAVELESYIVTTNVKFSEPFEYRLTVKGTELKELIWPQSKDFEPLFLKGIKQSKNSISYFLVPFEVSDQYIPTIQVVDVKDQSKIFKLPSIKLSVKWPEGVATKNISFIDMKDPMNLPYSSIDILLFLIPWMIVIVAVIYFLSKRRAKEEEQVNQVDIYQYVIDGLNNINVSDDEESIKRSCYKISELVRKYIAHSLSDHALEMTTAELNNKMKIDKIDNSLRRCFKEILVYCDEVKFACASITATDVMQTVVGAKDLIIEVEQSMHPEDKEEI